MSMPWQEGHPAGWPELSSPNLLVHSLRAASDIQGTRMANLLGRRRARKLVRMLWVLGRTPPAIIMPGSLVLVMLVGWLESSLGFPGGLVVLYVVPVLLSSWVGGFGFGQSVVMVTVGTMAFARHLAGAGVSLAWAAAPLWLAIALCLGIISYLAAAVSRILQYEQKSAHTDPLTGLANRRLLNEYYRGEIIRVRRYHRPMGLVYIDVDDFKQVNDRYGHQQGDFLLMDLAGLLINNTREIDTVARIGGDEFVLLLPETGRDGVEALMERIRQGLFSGENGLGLPVSLSMGAVVLVDPPEDIEAALKAADMHLSSVKNRGKGGVELVVMERGPD